MKSQLKRYIRQSFKQMGDLVSPAVYKREEGREFNNESGMMETTYSFHDVNIGITEFDRFELLTSTILPGDMKILLPAEQINFTPIPAKDSLIIDGTERILDTVQDKHGVMWILKI